MAKKKNEDSFMKKVGPWSFILGLIIAIISALSGSIFWMLGALGIVVGLLNISDSEISLYLLASLTFLVSVNALSLTVSNVVSLPVVGELLKPWLIIINALLVNISLFVAPGAAIVALKALYNLSKN